MPHTIHLLAATHPAVTPSCHCPPASPPRWLETQAHPEGPFLLGKDLSLADAALLPFLLRLPILQHYRGLALPQQCIRLARCIQAGKEAPAVKVRPAGAAAALLHRTECCLQAQYSCATQCSLEVPTGNS